MNSKEIIETILKRSDAEDLDFEFINKNLPLIDRIPDSESFLVKNELTKITSLPDSLIKTKELYLSDLFVYYLSGIEYHQEYIIGLMKEGLKSPSRLHSDKEFICEVLFGFEEYPPVIDFLKENPDYENHYLIEKILMEISDSEYEIGDLILKYLDDYYHIVRAAAIFYLNKKALYKYELNVANQLKKEDHPYIINIGTGFLKACGAFKTYEKAINQRLSYLKKQNGFTDTDIELEGTDEESIIKWLAAIDEKKEDPD